MSGELGRSQNFFCLVVPLVPIVPIVPLPIRPIRPICPIRPIHPKSPKSPNRPTSPIGPTSPDSYSPYLSHQSLRVGIEVEKGLRSSGILWLHPDLQQQGKVVGVAASELSFFVSLVKSFPVSIEHLRNGEDPESISAD